MSPWICRSECAPLALRTRGLCLWVTVAFDGDLRGSRIDVPDIVGCKLDRGRADVLLEAAEPGGAGDRDDPRLLHQKPSQCDLRRRGAFLCADLFQQIDHRTVRLARLGREPWQAATVVIAPEGGGLVDLAGEESPSQRTEGDETDPQFFADFQHLG